MKQKTRYKNFGNIGYLYRPQKSHNGRSLHVMRGFLRTNVKKAANQPQVP